MSVLVCTHICLFYILTPNKQCDKKIHLLTIYFVIKKLKILKSNENLYKVAMIEFTKIVNHHGPPQKDLEKLVLKEQLLPGVFF